MQHRGHLNIYVVIFPLATNTGYGNAVFPPWLQHSVTPKAARHRHREFPHTEQIRPQNLPVASQALLGFRLIGS